MAALTVSRSILYLSPINVTWTEEILYASGKIGMYKSILYESVASVTFTKSILYIAEDADYITAVYQ